jgi:hypothetical protein
VEERTLQRRVKPLQSTGFSPSGWFAREPQRKPPIKPANPIAGEKRRNKNHPTRAPKEATQDSPGRKSRVSPKRRNRVP